MNKTRKQEKQEVDTQKDDFKEMMSLLDDLGASSSVRIYTEGKSWEFDANKFRALVEQWLLEETKFMIQRRDGTTGRWESKEMFIVGKTLAQKLLNDRKMDFPCQELRVVPKAIADAYKQGWIDREFHERGWKPTPSNKPKRRHVG